jgi:chaperonin GroEL
MIKTEFGIELKKKLLVGIDIVNASVSSTLGPSGRNVLIRREDGSIHITKDGVTVAASITELEDEVENIGAQLLKQVAIKAADKVGDGTTTATLLATAMIREGIKSITQGCNPVSVKKGIDHAVKVVTGKLKEIAKDITGEEQIKQVATISANNDTEIGELIATAMDKVGMDGVVTIEESKTGETYLDTVEGIQFDRGYKSPFFVTDNNSMQAILEDPYILIYDDNLTTGKQLVPVLSAVNKLDRSLLIIARDIDGEALATLIVNKGRNIVKVCGVKAPEFGERRVHVLQDIATLTGGTLLSKDKGYDLTKMQNFDVKLLGQARMVTVTKEQTTIIDGKGDVDAISNRIVEIKTQLDKADSNFDTQILQSRLAKMTGGVAVVYVGGASEVEMREKKDRVDDALHATRAAIEEGIVPGGGMALMRCVDSLQSLHIGEPDEILGVEIVEKAIQEPFRKILFNAGIEDFYRILHCIDAESKDNWNGYNVKTGMYDNFLTIGVVDPVKVTRTALENAASIAGTVLTTESVVYLKTEKKTETNTVNYQDY